MALTEAEMKNRKDLNKKILKFVLLPSVLVLILFSILLSDNDRPEGESSQRTDYSVLFDTRQFVKARLTCPSTAKYGSDPQYVLKVNDSVYSVSSYVDSQNSYGAMVRANYTCKMTYFPRTGLVHCNGLKIE